MSTIATQRGRDLVDEYAEAYDHLPDFEIDTVARLVLDVLLYVSNEYGADQVEWVLDTASEGL